MLAPTLHVCLLSPLMKFADRMGSCRDKGRCGAGWGPCACPGGNASQWGFRGANRSHPNQDKHKAPSSTPPRPLSLQDPGPQHLTANGSAPLLMTVDDRMRSCALPVLMMVDTRTRNARGAAL